MDIYAENVLDHYRHPRHKCALPSPTITHTEENASCGDTLTLSLTVEDGIVTAVGWSGEGCAISQAAMSMLAEKLQGCSLSDVTSIGAKDIHALLKVPVGPRRHKCALLSLHTLKNALNTANGAPLQSWTETVATGEMPS